jgi:hypothetical protein
VQTARQLGGTFGLAVVGAVIAALAPTSATPSAAHQTAHAFEIGFLVAAAAVAVALLAGWRYLARGAQLEEVILASPAPKILIPSSAD